MLSFIFSLFTKHVLVLNCLINNTAPKLYKDDSSSGNVFVEDVISQVSNTSIQPDGGMKKVSFLISSSGSVIISACEANIQGSFLTGSENNRYPCGATNSLIIFILFLISFTFSSTYAPITISK